MRTRRLLALLARVERRQSGDECLQRLNHTVHDERIVDEDHLHSALAFLRHHVDRPIQRQRHLLNEGNFITRQHSVNIDGGTYHVYVSADQPVNTISLRRQIGTGRNHGSASHRAAKSTVLLWISDGKQGVAGHSVGIQLRRALLICLRLLPSRRILCVHILHFLVSLKRDCLSSGTTSSQISNRRWKRNNVDAGSMELATSSVLPSRRQMEFYCIAVQSTLSICTPKDASYLKSQII